MISAQFQRIVIRVDALKLRDRALLLAASIMLLFLVTDSMGFQPVYERKQSLVNGIEAQELQLELLRARSSDFDGNDNNERLIPLTRLREDLGSFGQKLQSRLDSMLSPDIATDILEQVMIHEKGLTLNAVSTRQSPLASVEGPFGNGRVIDNISRYELDLHLEGGYLDTLNYLQALEALPWKFFWTGITFAIADYPKASVDLEIYTLSQSGG